MSVVKKISFGNGQFNQFLFVPRETTSPPTQNRYQPPQYVAPQERSDDTVKTLSYISAGTALVTLGVASALAINNLRKGKGSDEMEAIARNAVAGVIDPLRGSISKLSDDMNGISGRFNDFQTNINNTVSNISNRVDSVSTNYNNIVDGARRELSEQINGVARAVNQTADGFFPCDVKINGKDLKLANVFNEIYGEPAEHMEKTLQSEATKRIFGFIDRSQKTPPEVAWVRVPTSEIRPFTNTGGLSIVPKELIANLAGFLNTKQKAKLLLDTPLYIGNAANNEFYRKTANYGANGVFDGTYSYSKRFWDTKTNSYKIDNMATLEKIDTMHLPIYTDKGRTTEKVDVYLSNEIQDEIPYKLLAERLEPDVLKDIEKAVANEGVWENELLKVTKDATTSQYVAKAKYKTVFYDSPKFDMSGRQNGNMSIYKNDSIEAGETERYVYFAKFFTEHLMRDENSSVKLGADLIIGNDWHTGPISAMLRQLTTARKAYGMDPIKADALHDTPIITILHNAGLTGTVWHSQSKLLNIMFGEHATKIATNSYMPNVAVEDKVPGLSSSLFNALFTNDGFNPQAMAAAYSDYIVPVSFKYGEEIASHSGFGGDCHDIFKIRARMFEFGDIENIQKIAENNDIPTELVKAQPTMIGITNGCDASNNVLTVKKARELEEKLGLPVGVIKPFKEGKDIAKWHNHNKGIYLNKVVEDLNTAKASNGVNNPMNIELPELTDLTGVTVNTPVFSTAGRIADQKGLDIFAESIKEFYKDFKGGEYPVFYAQGTGDESYIQSLLKVKKELAESGHEEAAKRIVFARLFKEAGRFDGCKLMSDFTIMSSWFEPCGLVHKEIAKYSGAIPICLDVGGLSAGLSHSVDSLILKFVPRYEADALSKNAKSLAEGLKQGYEWMKKPEEFAKALEASQKNDHSWLVADGPMDQYAKLFVDLKVFDPVILKTGKEVA